MLKEFRDLVMHGLGFLKYNSEIFERGPNMWRNTIEQIYYERKDAADSRIIFIDVSQDWNTMGVFIQTPFSSHFPWMSWKDLPVCDKNQRDGILKEFPQDIMYILKYADSFDFTLADACANNKFLKHKTFCNVTIVP